MIIPPVKNPDGTLTAAKQVNSYFLPLLQDLQRMGPLYRYTDIDRFHGILGSIPPQEIGMRCITTASNTLLQVAFH